MSAVMAGAKGFGRVGTLPPTRIVQRGFQLLGRRPSPPTRLAAATVAHFGFGAACGGLFGGLVRGRILPRRPVLEGLAFGGAVWGASYFGWVPALGVLPPPPLDRRARAVGVAVAHGVYGVLLGMLTPIPATFGLPEHWEGAR